MGVIEVANLGIAVIGGLITGVVGVVKLSHHFAGSSDLRELAVSVRGLAAEVADLKVAVARVEERLGERASARR